MIKLTEYAIKQLGCEGCEFFDKNRRVCVRDKCINYAKEQKYLNNHEDRHQEA